jgi:hypothetical protein
MKAQCSESHSDLGLYVGADNPRPRDGIRVPASWAEAFEVPVTTDASDPAKTWRTDEFNSSGVAFQAYAKTKNPCPYYIP